MGSRGERLTLDYELRPLNELIGKNIYYKKGMLYRFNKHGVIEAEPYSIEDMTYNERHIERRLIKVRGNEEALKHAVSRIEAGWTYEMLAEQLKESQEHYIKIRKLHDEGKQLHEAPVGIDAFLTHYESPIFERVPENTNQNTFDFIKVRVSYSSQWQGDKNAYIKENIKGITRRVVDHLKGYKRFQKYEVPVNMLTLAKVLNRMDSTLEFVFELKKELR